MTAVHVYIALAYQLGKTILGDAASVGNVSMTSGLVISNWIGRVVLSDSNSHEISEILGRYASGVCPARECKLGQNAFPHSPFAGDSVTLTMKGRNDSSIIPLLQHSIAAMEINCTLQGLTHNEDKLLQVRVQHCVAYVSSCVFKDCVYRSL